MVAPPPESGEERLHWGGRDAGELPGGSLLVSPIWNLTKTWLPPVKLMGRSGDGIQSWWWCSPAMLLQLRTENERRRPAATWPWHRLSRAPTMCSTRWKTLLSSPTTHSGRELASSWCEKPSPRQPDKHRAAKAASLISERSSNGRLDTRVGGVGGLADSGGSRTSSILGSVSMRVEDTALVLAMASTMSLCSGRIAAASCSCITESTPTTACIGFPMAFRIAPWAVSLALVAAASSLRARSSAPCCSASLCRISCDSSSAAAWDSATATWSATACTISRSWLLQPVAVGGPLLWWRSSSSSARRTMTRMA